MNTLTCQICDAPIDQTSDSELCPACVLRGVVGFSFGDDDGDVFETVTKADFPRSFGPYALVEEIGRGGMGVVYRAQQLALDRTVAIKLLLAGAHASELALRRFRQEAAAAAGLQHPNVVAIHDYGDVDGQPYYAMDLVKGRNLSEVCEGRPLEPRRAAALLLQLARTVQYAHERGVLHRDLKPSNVMIDTSDRPRIADFGLAKLAEPGAVETLSGQALGSPGYMAPEQVRGDVQRINATTDVYGLGALGYHLLTGRAPHNAPTAAETLRQVLETTPPSSRVLNPSVPRDLETICLKCLEANPARRYASAAELAEDLDRFISDLPIRARAPGKLYRAAKYARRHWVGVSAVAAVVLLIFGGLGATIYSFQRAVRLHREAIAAHGNSREIVETLMLDLEKRARIWDPRPWIESALRAVEEFQELPTEFRDIETKRELARIISLLIRNRIIWSQSGSDSWVVEVDRKEAELFDVAASLWEEVARNDPTDDEAAAAVLRHAFRRDVYREARYAATNVIGVTSDATFAEYDRRALELLRQFPSSLHAELALIEVRRHWMAILAEWGESERSDRLVGDVEVRNESLLERYPRDLWVLSERERTLKCLQYCYRINGELERAHEVNLERLRTQRSILVEDPDNMGLVGETAQRAGALTNTATPGDLDAAIRDASEYIDRMLEVYPEDTYWLLWQANMDAKSGFSLASDRRYAEAQSKYEAGLAIVERVPRAAPKRQGRWVWYRGALGSLAARLGNRDAAVAYLEQLRADRPVWVSETDNETEQANRRVQSWIAEHHVLEALGAWGELEKLGQVMARDLERIEQSEVPFRYLASHLGAVTGAIMGKALLMQGHYIEALPWLERVEDRIGTGVSLGITRWSYPNSELWEAGEDLSEALVQCGDPAGAGEVLIQVLQEWQNHVEVGGKLLSRIAAARCSWKLARLLDEDDPSLSARRSDLLRRAAEILDDPATAPRLLADERRLRENIALAQSGSAAAELLSQSGE